MHTHHDKTASLFFKHTLSLVLILLGLLVMVQPLQATPPIAGSGRAWDSADARAYNPTWDNGDDDGTGFGPWALSTSGGNAGHFIGTSTGNGNGDTNADGDININGEAWGMYANSGDVANAVRPFDAVLTTGDHFYLQMDNGSIGVGGTVGFGLQNSSGANLAEFFFVGGTSNYTLNDAAGATDTGIGFTDEGLALRFDLTGANTYRLVVTLVETGSSSTFYGTLINPGTGQAVSQVRLFNANAGNGGGNDVFFNGLRIGASTVEFSDTAVSYGNPALQSYQVALGDVDNDGDLDAFIGNNNAAGNTVWLNDGSGGYSDSGQSLGTNFTNYVALGDLDNDGDLDAFEVNLLSPNRVWVNQGGDQMGTLGTFADSGQSLGAAFPNNEGLTVALGDLDGDGDLDAFVGNGLSASFGNTVYLNQGGAQMGTLGTFVDSGQSLGNSGSQAVALGDLDGDGDLDAFVGNNDAAPAGRANKVYINDGVGVFTESGQNLGDFVTTAVELADLDNDGDLDAFVGNSTTASNTDPANRVWLNNGSGTFSNTFQRLGHSDTFGISLGDLDGDGDIDAYAANNAGTGPGADQIWLNNGSGGIFSDSGLLLGNSNSHGVDLGDIDQDGDLDAFVANNSQANLVWTNEAVHRNAPFTANGSLTYFGNDLKFGDLDGDGDFDLITAGINAINTSRVYLNNGTGSMSNSGQNFGSTASTRVELGDVDGDGDLDAFFIPNALWLNNGSATFSNSGQSLGSSTQMDFGDVDGDGDLDIFLARTGANQVWLNDGGGTFTDSGQSLGSSTSRDVALADVDGDGDLDAFVVNNGANRIWLNDGSGTFTDSTQTLGTGNSFSVELEDLNGDGDLDAFVGNNGANLIWVNDGSGTFSDSGQTLGSSLSNTIVLGDIDADGDLDAVDTNASPVRFWINDGSGIFSDSGQSIPIQSIRSIDLADVDSDGDLDTWTVSNTNATSNLLRNVGGSAGFTVTDTSINAGYIEDGTEDDVMRVVFTHNGLATDHDLELDYWNITLLAANCSTPLTSAAVNTNLAALRVRLDDGDSTFETDGSDVQVGIVSTGSFNLQSGVQQIVFANDDANVQVSGTSSKTYWVSLEAPIDQGQLGICLRLDPDANMLVEGKTPDFSVSVQDSSPTTTTNTPTAVSLQFVGTVATANGSAIALLAVGVLLLTLGAVWVRRRTD